MPITWFSTKEKTGSASFYSTNITLNTIATVPFEYAYRVQVGMDKERVLRGDLDEYAIQQIAIKKTYSRISSTTLMKRIAESLNITLGEKPMKFDTTWDEVENILTIHTGKEK